MNLTTRLASTLAATATLAALAAGTAQAAVHPNGYLAYLTCTNATGALHLTPGLTGPVRNQNALLSATIAGCSDVYGDTFAGTGTLTAQLTGTGSALNGANLTGTFVVTWPTSAGFNPTTGSLTINATTATLTVSGTTTGGAWIGNNLATNLFISSHNGTGHKLKPITTENLLAAAPVTFSHSSG